MATFYCHASCEIKYKNNVIHLNNMICECRLSADMSNNQIEFWLLSEIIGFGVKGVNLSFITGTQTPVSSKYIIIRRYSLIK